MSNHKFVKLFQIELVKEHGTRTAEMKTF